MTASRSTFHAARFTFPVAPMLDFTYEALPGRVIFGRDSLAQLPQEVARLGASRALILCTPGQRALAEAVAERLGAQAVGIFAGAVMHVPIEVAGAARA